MTNEMRSPAIEKRFDLCRALDLTVALPALIFLLPLMTLVAVAIKLQDGGPVLFGHRRFGYRGETFRCWKFRSMVVDAESRLQRLLDTNPVAQAEWAADHKLRNDPRVTWLGRFLRSSSIDELPQLLNVLLGDMSLVGPRPIVASEISRYGCHIRAYYEVRPGITGLWQINGRNDVSYRRRIAFDVLYARHRSLKLNIGILAATLPAVLSQSGSY